MQRLGKNIGGYRGEGLSVDRVLSQIRESANRTGWHQSTFSIQHACQLLAYTRAGVASRKNIYISAGIHGHEPGGPLAVLGLLEANQWPDTCNIWLCPCLNLSGLMANRRENVLGIDLNRDYLHLRTVEAQTHVEWLRQQPAFDLCLCLHEDWEASGFYLYELNPDNHPSFAHEVIQAVSPVCPIDASPIIDGREANAGVIRPNPDPASRPEWPEAFFLLTHKTRQVYTLEAPSDYPLETRVAGLIAAVRAILQRL